MDIVGVCKQLLSLYEESYIPDIDAHDERLARLSRENCFYIARECLKYRKALEEIVAQEGKEYQTLEGGIARRALS